MKCGRADSQRKFNGVPYVIQRAAEAAFFKAGNRRIKEKNINYYIDNAQMIANLMKEKKIFFLYRRRKIHRTSGLNAQPIPGAFSIFLLKKTCKLSAHPVQDSANAAKDFFPT